MELKNDHGGQYYEGEATVGNNTYDFEIDASSGKITKCTKSSDHHDSDDHDGHDSGDHENDHDND